MTPYSNKLICIVLVLAVCGCSKFPTANDSVFNRLNKVSAISQDQIDLQFGMARVTERNANPHEARRAYQQVLDQRPNHAGAIHRLGVMLVKQDQIEESLTYFQSALEHARKPTAASNTAEPVEPDAELVTEILGDLGYAQYLAGDLENAEKNLTLAKQHDPSNERIVNNLAIVVGVGGDLKKSLFLFRSNGSEAEAMANLAYVQTQIGDLDGAKSSYHRALEKDGGLKVAANGLLELHQKVPARVRQEIEPRQMVEPAHQAMNQTQIASAPKQNQTRPTVPRIDLSKAIVSDQDVSHLIVDPVEQIQTRFVKGESNVDSELAINAPLVIYDSEPNITVSNKTELIQQVGFEESVATKRPKVVSSKISVSKVDKSKATKMAILSPLVSLEAFKTLSPIVTSSSSLKKSSSNSHVLSPVENKLMVTVDAPKIEPEIKKDMRPGINANDFSQSESSK